MAALPYVPTVPDTPLSNRNNGNSNTTVRQPSGPCNYTNLNTGPKCGCLRFTDQALEAYGVNAASAKPGYCVCEHHSCFHSHDPVDGHGFTRVATIDGSSTPRQSNYQVTTQSRLEYMQDVQEVGRQESYLPDAPYPNPGISMGSFPAIPSQCLLPSENGSRASSSQAGYCRPFSGRGLDTLSHIPKRSSACQNPPASAKSRYVAEDGKTMQVYEDSLGNGHLQSITEVATPSIRSSQDMEVDVVFGQHVAAVQDALHTIAEGDEVTMALRPSQGIPIDPMSAPARNSSIDENLLPRIRSIINHVADYPMTKRNHEHRLDRLENGSFSYPCFDEMKDQHANLDTRVQELEDRVDEVEKQTVVLFDNQNASSRQALNTSMDSETSSTSEQPHMARFEALESQLLELQAAAPPSIARPWEVEVVFLPFGPDMKGIWSSQGLNTPRSRVNSGTSDEWTQTQNTSGAAEQARLTAYNQAHAWETCFGESSEDHPSWSMPRACALGSLVDERLRSRGLVKKIQIKGPDARDVQAAMYVAFGELPSSLAQDPYEYHNQQSLVPDFLGQYLGLRHPWIPLRKDHKVSSLRFLNTSEMITPALWSVNFLKSSVVMRSSPQRRLFVTQPESYLQHFGSSVSWTWQKLRQLDPVYPKEDVTKTLEPNAERTVARWLSQECSDEKCWEFDERYDPLPSLESSITSNHSLSIRSAGRAFVAPISPSDHFSSRPASLSPSTPPTSIPTHTAQASSPLRERNPFRPSVHSRTTSMPTSVPVKVSPSQNSKRPIGSYEPEPDPESQPSLGRVPIPLHLHISKRHRTRSPSRPRDTPRWSTGPSSPYAYVEETHSKRGTTPFAYATPHSNLPYVERRVSGETSDGDGGSTTDDSELIGGDANALSDFEFDHDGDEWEGVDDDMRSSNMQVIEKGEGSDNESTPSEYPSTQPDAQAKGNAYTKAGFRIHVDEEGELPDTY